MSTIRQFFDWLICGYSEDGNAAAFTRGFRIGLLTRRGRAVLWVLDLDQAIRNAPWSFKWFLADTFSRWAAQLRGESVEIFGFYDTGRGNKAAQLVDGIKMKMLIHLPSDALCSDEMEDIHAKLERLGSLAEATCWRNNTPPR